MTTSKTTENDTERRKAARPWLLLVEDNEDDAFLTLRALQENHVTRDEVMLARDGAEALDYLLSRGRYADQDKTPSLRLILLDVNLPKVTGLEVLRALRSDERTERVPVVMLTTSRAERDVVESYTQGANSYIRKPVRAEEFRQAVKDLALYWRDRNVTHV